MVNPSAGSSSQPLAGPSKSSGASDQDFDVVAAYNTAVENDSYPHPLAAILALVQVIQASTTETTSGLARELRSAREKLTQSSSSLGLRAGCQLWERYFADSQIGASENFVEYKQNLITQGRLFCDKTAEECREKIAKLAVGFLRDGSTILTHSYSRVVMKALVLAHKQNKRIKVYVTEAKPNGLGLRTHQELTALGIPCYVVLDSAVAYVIDRVNMILVGCEAVVESGGIVSAVGTYQMGVIANFRKNLPFYALAESYKFLRHFPLRQTDLPVPKPLPGHPRAPFPLEFRNESLIEPSVPAATSSTPLRTPTKKIAADAMGTVSEEADVRGTPPSNPHLRRKEIPEMTREMLDLNPLVDYTSPNLIQYIFSDLGSPLTPASVSQYLVAQFAT